MVQHIQQEILDAVGKKFMQGDKFKIRHKFRLDGTICTPDTKSPAMSVTRTSNGWLFCCHRCTAMGTIPDTDNSSGMTRQRLNALKDIPKDKESKKIKLPYDFKLLVENKVQTNFYHPAVSWLWKYNVFCEDMERFGIGWSDSYERLIVPLYEYNVTEAEIGETLVTFAKKLVGWVGRDVEDRAKGERAEKKIPKWLSRTEKGARRYFTAKGKDKIVLVEDSISAMRVNMATSYTSIALLNASVNDDLMRKCSGSKVWLWLDPDMKKESIKTVSRMNQLGLHTKIILTEKDPKEYPERYIRTILDAK